MQFHVFLFGESTEVDGSDSSNPLPEPALTAWDAGLTPNSLWTQENSFTLQIQQEFCHALLRTDLLFVQYTL